VSLYYGYDGQPISLDEWIMLFSEPERFLKQEWVHIRDGKRYWISTVYMGLDHNPARWLRDEPAFDWIPDAQWFVPDDTPEIDTRPWVFETMAFKNEPAWNDVFARSGEDVGQIREATRKEALQSHERMKRELAE
jgi:hypothetical protein